ncbi:MAG: C40 family peptidase [Actinomycetota bacterium]
MLRLSASWRAFRAQVAAVLAIALLVPILPIAAREAGAAPQDDLEDKQAIAAELERDIAENGTRISILDEQYNQTRLQIELATQGITAAQAKLDAVDRRIRELQTRLAGRAASLYLQAASDDPIAMLDVDEVAELGSRSKYGDAAAQEDGELIGELDAAQENLHQVQLTLEHSREDARASEAALERTRSELVAAQVDQQELLSRVEGDIAQLVAEIEEQRRLEEEARVRAEFERRRRDEQAARDEATRRDAAARAAAAADTENGAATTTPRRATTPPPEVPAPNENAQVAIDAAKAQLGKPYVYAADGPDSFDCSGLTQFAWGEAGVGIPHSSRAQFDGLPHVSMDELAPGDLVFYGDPIHHVGIYVGDGQYVNAPQTGDVVKVSSIYRDDFAGAARPG